MQISSVIQAFKIISIGNDALAIKQSNDYLKNCQKQSGFASLLLNLFGNTDQSILQLHCILLFTNIIKRHWKSKRHRSHQNDPNYVNLQSDKISLRTNIITAYHLKADRHSKHLDQILKFLAKQDYPTQYQQLHTFMENCLIFVKNSIDNGSIDWNVCLRLLTTIKCIMKEYSLKRLSHSSDLFKQYIINMIKFSLQIAKQIQKFMNQNQKQQEQNFIKILDCCKKIYLIILFGMQSMPNNFQLNHQISYMIQDILKHVNIINSSLVMSTITTIKLKSNLQQYLASILKQIGRLQVLYPFMFQPFLSQYLTFILNLLLKNTQFYTNQKLWKVLLIVNTKPFNTFPYYMLPSDFKGSAYCRKSKNDGNGNQQIQQSCFKQFMQINADNVASIMMTIIRQVMSSPVIMAHYNSNRQEEQLILEEENTNPDTITEPSPYENCLILIKQILRCFKKQLKPIIDNILKQLTNPDLFVTTDTTILCNSLELLLMVPLVYDQSEINLEQIANIMSLLYQAAMYTILAKMIKHYHQYFDQAVLNRCFSILTQLISTNNSGLSVQIIYQCAITLKKMINQHQPDTLPLQQLPSCIHNILIITRSQQYIRNPTLLWPLINLITQLIKLLPEALLNDQLTLLIISGLQPLATLQHNDQLIVCAVSEVLETIIDIIGQPFKDAYLNPEYDIVNLLNKSNKSINAAFLLSAELLNNNLHNKNLENIDNLMRLWLNTMRNYPIISQQCVLSNLNITQLNQFLEQLLRNNSEQLMKTDGVIFIELLEEYAIVGIQLICNDQVLYQLIQSMINSVPIEHNTRIIMCITSFYLTYVQLNQKFIPKIILLLSDKLFQLNNQISPKINALRTLLMLTIDKFILIVGAKQYYALMNEKYGSSKWFHTFTWALQYVSNKFCFKVNAFALLKMMDELSIESFSQLLTTPLQGQYPLDIILKVLHIQLESMNKTLVSRSYNNLLKQVMPIDNNLISNCLNRRVKLHLQGIMTQIIQNDLTPFYHSKIKAILIYWNWGKDDLQSRFDQSTTDNIMRILNNLQQ